MNSLRLTILILSAFIFAACASTDPEVEKTAGLAKDEYSISVGDENKTHKQIIAEQKEIIRRQQEEIKRQDREVVDLKRQQYHNANLRRFE